MVHFIELVATRVQHENHITLLPQLHTLNWFHLFDLFTLTILVEFLNFRQCVLEVLFLVSMGGQKI